MTRDFKIGIVSGLIGSALFAIFIGPILRWSSKIILSVGSKVYSSWIDRLYAAASLGVPKDSAFFLLSTLLAVATGIFTGIYVEIIMEWCRDKRKEKQKPKQKPRSFSDAEWRIIKNPWIYAIGVVLVYLFVVMLFWSSWFNITVTTSWKHHMLIVAPYLTDQEAKQMWSEWARIKNKVDYDKLYEKLTMVADKNKIKLPDNPGY
jgi:H+/Cl- antiporter ClcA